MGYKGESIMDSGYFYCPLYTGDAMPFDSDDQYYSAENVQKRQEMDRMIKAARMAEERDKALTAQREEQEILSLPPEELEEFFKKMMAEAVEEIKEITPTAKRKHATALLKEYAGMWLQKTALNPDIAWKIYDEAADEIAKYEEFQSGYEDDFVVESN